MIKERLVVSVNAPLVSWPSRRCLVVVDAGTTKLLTGCEDPNRVCWRGPSVLSASTGSWLTTFSKFFLFSFTTIPPLHQSHLFTTVPPLHHCPTSSPLSTSPTSSPLFTSPTSSPLFTSPIPSPLFHLFTSSTSSPLLLLLTIAPPLRMLQLMFVVHCRW